MNSEYLLIHDKIPFVFPENDSFLKREKYSRLTDDEFAILNHEFNSFLKEKENPNLLSLGIGYCYGDIKLPQVYDVIFDTVDRTRYWEQKTIARYAFNYRTHFHTDLWKGHSAHCFIEIIGSIPEIFDEFPENNGGLTLHKGIGLCTNEEWFYLKNR